MLNRSNTTNMPRFSRRVKIVSGIIGLIVIGAMLLGIMSNLGGNSSRSEVIGYPGASDNYSKNSSSGMSAAATTAASAAAPAAVAAGGAAAPKNGAADFNLSDRAIQNNLPADRMIIRNASLAVQADDVEKFLGNARALAAEQNGTVMQTNTSFRDNKTYANIVLQVPSAAFDVTISRLRQLAFKVENENSTSQDVTEEFVDVDAQIRNLKATEASYLELLKQAKNVNDTLTVQRELTNVRGEIERRQGRLNFLQKKSDTSTISLSVSPRGVEATKSVTSSWEVGRVLDDAWQGSLKGLQGLATVLITLAVYGWWVLPLLALAYFVARTGLKRVSPKPQLNPKPQAQD